MMSPKLNTYLGIAVGFCLGCAAGVVAYPIGFTAGTDTRTPHLYGTNTLCIHGFAYQVVATDAESAWEGTPRIKPVFQEPAISTKREELQPLIPARCHVTINR